MHRRAETFTELQGVVVVGLELFFKIMQINLSDIVKHKNIGQECGVQIYQGNKRIF